VRTIDLSQPFFHNGAYNPDLPLPTVQLVRHVVTDGFRLEELSLCTHVGTHMDAPSHVLEGGFGVDQYPLDRLHGRAVPVDLRELGEEGEISADVLAPYDDRLIDGTIALLMTGWGASRGYTDWYINRSPWLSRSGAEWLVERDVAGVVIDHFSISGRGAQEKTLPAHEILLGAGTWIIEEAFLPVELLERPAWYVIALPLRLVEGSGAPARVIAIDVEDLGTNDAG
jgi:kynurenine formamidase